MISHQRLALTSETVRQCVTLRHEKENAGRGESADFAGLDVHWRRVHNKRTLRSIVASLHVPLRIRFICSRMYDTR